MVMSTGDDPRPVPPDFDRRRMASPAQSPAASPPRGCRTPTPERRGHRGQPQSPGRPANGYHSNTMHHRQQDAGLRSPIRSSFYATQQPGTPGVRRTTTQFVYPTHSTAAMDSMAEKMKHISVDEGHSRRQRSWTRSMDLGGLFAKMNEASILSGNNAESGGKDCLKSAPNVSDRKENEDDHEPRTAAMLDAYWHKQKGNGDAHLSSNSCGVQRQPSWHPDVNFQSPPRTDQSPEHIYGDNNINKRRENPVSSSNGTREVETSVAGLMKRCQFLEAESQYLREREVELREDLCRARAENSAISGELRRTHDLYREALAARRNAREALSEMAQQNARLVSAYVEKKQEFRNLQETFDEECRRWRNQVESLQNDLLVAREAQAMNSPTYSDSDTVTTGVSMTHSSDEEDSFPVCFSKVAHSKQENGKHTASRTVTSASDDVQDRVLQELRLENIRLQEENKKLKLHCEDVEKEKQKSDAYQKSYRVEELKQKGNSAFGERRWEDAVSLYSQAIDLRADDIRMNAVLHCNRASCYINTERFLEAMMDCHLSVSFDASYYKGYLRRADVLTMLGDHAGALQDLRVVVMARSPDSNDAREKLKQVQAKLRAGHVLNPYRVLSIPDDASSTEIRLAYKKLALKYHPDKAEVKETAAAVFKMVSEANSILSDEDKKREYDTRRAILRSRR